MSKEACAFSIVGISLLLLFVSFGLEGVAERNKWQYVDLYVKNPARVAARAAMDGPEGHYAYRDDFLTAEMLFEQMPFWEQVKGHRPQEP